MSHSNKFDNVNADPTTNAQDFKSPSRNYDNTNIGPNTAGSDQTAQGGYHDQGQNVPGGPTNGVAQGRSAQTDLAPQGQRETFGAQPTTAGRWESQAPGVGDNQTVGGPTGGNQHNLRHDAEGAAAGGVAGREFDKHHNHGPGAGTGAAAGGIAGHEYNKHHDNRVEPQSNATRADQHLGTAGAATTASANQNASGYSTQGAANYGQNTSAGGYDQNVGNTGFGAGGAGGPGAPADRSNATRADHHLGTAGATTAAGAVGGHEYTKHHNQGAVYGQQNYGAANPNAPVAGNQNPAALQAEAKSLDRSGKVERAIGTVIRSTSMKERGIMKQADAAAMARQARESQGQGAGPVGAGGVGLRQT